ncbi:hypothetical protein ACP4OV_012655 [Aristida adscensionis]
MWMELMVAASPAAMPRSALLQAALSSTRSEEDLRGCCNFPSQEVSRTHWLQLPSEILAAVGIELAVRSGGHGLIGVLEANFIESADDLSLEEGELRIIALKEEKCIYRTHPQLKRYNSACHEATPKGVLKLMKADNLTIYHVKSHLQKYRTARYRPELSEGSSEKKGASKEDIPSIDLKGSSDLTEALRLQLELLKRLHEQLETEINFVDETVRTLAGNGTKGSDYKGGGQGTNQVLNSPWNVCYDPSEENVYIPMAGQHQIWKHNVRDGVTKVLSGDGYKRNLNG